MAYSYDRQARDFPTEEALKEYLREHPDANRSLHHVKKDDDGEKKRDPRDYARERAKHAPPKKTSPLVGIPSLHAASDLVRRVVTRFLAASTEEYNDHDYDE